MRYQDLCYSFTAESKNRDLSGFDHTKLSSHVELDCYFDIEVAESAG